MPFSVEGHNFTRSHCMQRNVEVEIESMDRVGNFVGWLHVCNTTSGAIDQTTKQASVVAKSSGKKKNRKNTEQIAVKSTVNFNVLLVSNGLATVHHTPAIERSTYYHDLCKAEESAKTSNTNLWSSEEFLKQWQADSAQVEEEESTNGTEMDQFIFKTRGPEYLDDLSSLNLNDGTPEKTAEKV